MPLLQAYAVCRIGTAMAWQAGWEDAAWAGIPVAAVANFRPEGSDHRPVTEVRLAWDGQGLQGLFRVQDRFVRSVQRGVQVPVYQDSCVEFFVQPVEGGGYFNFEFNAGGAMLVYWIEDPQRTAGGFRRYTILTEADCRTVGIAASLPPVIDPEITTPQVWTLGFTIPLSLLERYAGPLQPLAGGHWRGNFYKCGDGTSHPHWAAWSAVDELDFHCPPCFGQLDFQ